MLVSMMNGEHSQSAVQALRSLAAYRKLFLVQDHSSLIPVNTAPARKEIIAAKAIPLLVPMLLEPTRGQAASILAWLAYEGTSSEILTTWLSAERSADDDARAEILENGAMTPLISMLSSGADRPVAAEALKCLIWHGPYFVLSELLVILTFALEKGRVRFLKENATSLLVQALNYTDSRKHAAYALACIAEKGNLPESTFFAIRSYLRIARSGPSERDCI